MVCLFSSQTAKNPNKALGQHEFFKRIKKTLYYGPSNPNRMISQPLARHVITGFNDTHRGYDLKRIDLPTLSKFRDQTPCSLILSMIYLDRLIKSDPAYCRLITPSELLLVTLMVSAKFYSDYDEMDVYLSSWAEESGDVTVERLKQLEVQFLNAIQWNLLVSQNEFYEKLRTVERLLAMKEGLARNWFTYTELELNMPTLDIAKKILNYTTILMFSYVCSVLTIALSCIVVTSIPTPLTSTPTITTACENVTALLPNVMISNDLKPSQTECTFINEEELSIDEEKNISCNFTIDFSIFNALFEDQLMRNYQDTNFQIGFHKHNSVPLVW